MPAAPISSDNYATHSRLAEGKWLKISVTQSGIHKISYSTLNDWGFTSPEKVNVFGYGGEMVPSLNSSYRPDDIPMVGVWHYNDAIYFYGQGPVTWDWDEDDQFFRQQQHLYSEKAYYFLSETDDTKTIVEKDSPTGTITYETNSYDYLDFHEDESVNPLPSGKKSGRKKFGEIFSSTALSYQFTFTINNLISTEPVKIGAAAAARSAQTSYLNFFSNDDLASFLTLSFTKITIGDYEGYYAREDDGLSQIYITSEDLNLTVTYSDQSSTSYAWLDYITINARAELTLDNDELIFRDVKTLNSSGLTKFSINNVNSSTVVWNITDITSPSKVSTTLNGDQLTFLASEEDLNTYIAFNPDGTFPSPVKEETVANQDLHELSGIDYVIVAPEEFSDYAEELASLHNTYNDLQPIIVTPQQIYNEFSWGHTDPTAIRSFMRMLYEKAGENSSERPKYLLLFGNGYYSNQTTDDPATNTWIPTYESENSIHLSQSYVTDDYYGFLDSTAGANDAYDKLRIGIGRFPVRTQSDARIAVDKVKTYLEDQATGQWRKTITFVADDEDSNIHMSDADDLAKKVTTEYPSFDVEKIYLDSYTQTSTSMGDKYPEAQEAIDRAIAEGTLIFNYVGHGGTNGLSGEQVITSATIQNWTNINRLPLFVTATCEFSRFDDPDNVSAGELVFLNANGGAIALLSTTRLVYSSLNHQLNEAFFDQVFKTQDDNSRRALGDIIKETKNNTGNTINKLNFTLLGDPALKLNYPDNKINTVKINGTSVSATPDTLKALSIVEIEGEITDIDDNLLSDFNGTVEISVFDKALTINTKGNDGETPFEYTEYSNLLFKGTAEVEQGQFTVQFMVPYDIRYNFDYGRISYYAISEDQSQEAMGAFTNFIVGGFNPDAEEDNEGPEVNFYINHTNFKDGDETGSQPILYLELNDASGINTTGSGIGHDLLLIIDGDYDNPISLNDYFQANENSYQSGTLIYQLSALETGDHELDIKVWDNFNNSTTVSTYFKVTDDDALTIRNINYYPNPVELSSPLYLNFETEEGNTIISITVTGYNQAGEKTGTEEYQSIADNNFIGPIVLYLSSLGIKQQGWYILQFDIETSTGKSTQTAKKIIVFP